ncbi:MAG: DEAD/DEAH box helicase [Desulfovibrio sp.]|nr:DEAD/DEAH box helicase [Desulfovibrio sp.]
MSYSEIRLSTHAFVPKSELTEDLDELIRSFTRTSRYEESIHIPLVKETAESFGFPLYLKDFSKETAVLKDERSQGLSIDVEMSEGFSLRDNQRPLVEEFLKLLQEGKTGWLINMPTGSGKTVCALRMLKAIGRTTLIIVPRDNLIQQWSQRIQQFTNIQASEIGLAQQDTCDYQGKKVVIGMIHSLAKDKYPQAFCKAFGLVIWDEVHVAAAQSFSQTLSIFAPKYRIGMSATLHRRDGLQDIYKLSIGQNVLAISAHTLLQPNVYILKYKAAKTNYKINFIKNANFRRAKLLSLLAEDAQRNALLASHIAKIAQSGRRTVVFSERIQQLKDLQALLTQKQAVNAEDIGLFTGETKEAERRKILAQSPIILATYGVMALGVDVPDLRAVVFATPQANVAQAVGRILRVNEESLDPVVLDVVDTSYQDCHFWAASRKKYYQKTAQAQLFELV